MSTSCDDDSFMEIVSWAKVPTSVSGESPYVVICDEAHSMQSMESARTKNVLKLVGDTERCIGVLMLTGTPIKNGKPSNLFPLLKAVRHPFGNHQRIYEIYFCAAYECNYGRGRVWNISGSANLPQLQEFISSHVLRITKEECLKNLPPQTRSFRQVPVSSRQQLRYIIIFNI